MGGKKYSQTVEHTFHISKAALDLTSTSEDDTSLILDYEGQQEFILCHLNKKTNKQESLDLNFQSGDSISLYSVGPGSLHLSGYLLGEDDDDDMTLGSMMEEEEDEEDEEEDEEEEGKVLFSNSKKRPLPAGKTCLLAGKKQKMDNDEESDDGEEEEDEKEAKPKAAVKPVEKPKNQKKDQKKPQQHQQQKGNDAANGGKPSPGAPGQFKSKKNKKN